MEITGAIIQILPPQTGQGKNGPWKKQEFVIETTESYPKKVCIAAWGDKIEINKLKIGIRVKIQFDIESREYNGKWYTDLKAYKLEPSDESQSLTEIRQTPDMDESIDVLPF